MSNKLTTIKVTIEAKRNFKGAAYLTNRTMYGVAEAASEMYLSFIEKEQLRLDKKSKSKKPNHP